MHTVRFLSENARTSVPEAPPAEIKGVFSSPLRVKTCSETAEDENNEGEQAEMSPVEEVKKSKLTDTHLALIILSTFLLICGLIAGILRWFMSDLQL